MPQSSLSRSTSVSVPGNSDRERRGIILCRLRLVSRLPSRLSVDAGMADAQTVRLVGGCLVLATEHDPQNLGLLITTIVLLNVGLIPLLFSYHRLVRMM